MEGLSPGQGHDVRQDFQTSAVQRQAELLLLIKPNGQRHRMPSALESIMRGDGNCLGPLPSMEAFHLLRGTGEVTSSHLNKCHWLHHLEPKDVLASMR